MAIPKRFALSTLLLLMLIVASIFGFAQWRRQSLISEANDLREMGVAGVAVKDSWFWPSLRPYQVDVKCVSYSPTVYSPSNLLCSDVVVSAATAYEFYSDIAGRLNELGVEKDQITYTWHHYVASTHHGKDIKELGELKRPFFDELGRE